MNNKRRPTRIIIKNKRETIIILAYDQDQLSTSVTFWGCSVFLGLLSLVSGSLTAFTIGSSLCCPAFSAMLGIRSFSKFSVLQSSIDFVTLFDFTSEAPILVD